MSSIKIAYKTIPAIKTSINFLTKEVVSIVYNKKPFSLSKAKNRIFLDAKNQFWYLTKGGLFPEKYAYSNMGGVTYQAITIDGDKLVFPVNQKMTLVETSVEENLNTNIVLNVAGQYRLRNGLKMKIFAYTNDEEFASEPTFIGLYRHQGFDSAIRYSENGKVLSHGGDITFEIESEWIEKEVWVVVGPNPNITKTNSSEFISQTFETEEEAKKSVGTSKSFVITKVVV